MAGTVKLTVDGNLAVLRLGRAHGNAINPELVGDLTEACARIDGNNDIHGVLLAAEGKLFSPGLDLQELVELDRDSMLGFTRRFNACIAALYGLTPPVVAALHGHAVAGGCVLGLTADWRMLAEGAMVGLNEVRVGVPLPFGVATLLAASVPVTHLEEVALFGKNYTGAEAVDAGLVHEVQPAAGFENRCMERLAELDQRDANALAITKRYLRGATLAAMRRGDAERVEQFVDSWFRPETRERVMAVVDQLRQRGKS